MRHLRKVVLGVGAAMMTATAVMADDFGVMPANYEAALENYVGSRLTNPRGARFQIVGQPYRVYADFDGYSDVAAWAVDVRVRSRLPNGAMGTVPYTVIFVGGVPVALEQDIGGVEAI